MADPQKPAQNTDPWADDPSMARPQAGTQTSGGHDEDWKMWQAGAGQGAEQPGFLESTGEALGLHSIMHPVETIKQKLETPLHSAAQLIPAFAGPEMIYQGGKRIAHELGQAYTAAREGSPGAAASHAISAIPLLGPALDTATEAAQARGMNAPGNSYLKNLGIAATTPGTVGTVAGTSLAGAATALGALDTAAPGRTPLMPIKPAIQNAAMGSPDVAALKAFRIGPGSPKADTTLAAVRGARPFVQGVKSLDELKAATKPGGSVRSQIWDPYKQVIDSPVGDRVVQGPDGPTTVRSLEAERKQLSAINRGLKQQVPNPEAVQLAEQKGLTQSQALAREDAVQAALDPELQSAGIDPQLIRKTFGHVAQVGKGVSGKSTLTESKPYGLGRMANMSFAQPRTWLGEPAQGVRDIIAGRPWWSGKPTDINIREAFRTGGPMPDFRAPSTAMPRFEYPPLQLEANVPGNAEFGPGAGPGSNRYGNGITPSMEGTNLPASMGTQTPLHRIPAQLPSVTTPGEVQPMARYATPYVEPPEPTTIRTQPQRTPLQLPAETTPGETMPYVAYRPAPPQGEVTRIVPTRLERLQMQAQAPQGPGGIRRALSAPDVPTPSPEPTMAHVFPAGSAYRDLPMETPVYPAGSQFRQNIKPFDLDAYLQQALRKPKE